MTTKTAKHTPGPWKYWTNELGTVAVGPDGNRPVAKIFGDTFGPGLANAALIARAPEMAQEIESLKAQRDALLEAAKVIQHAFAHSTPYQYGIAGEKALEAIDTAILKAGG